MALSPMFRGRSMLQRSADAALDDSAWAEYLFMRHNPKGRFAERWVHSAGCRRWFHVVRDTATHRILAVYKIGDPPPGITNLRGAGA